MNIKKVYLIIGIVVIPIILSQIIRLPFGKWTIGDENAWVGFLGSYIGAIVSIAVTYIIFLRTLKNDREKHEEQKSLTIRPYLAVKHLDEENEGDDQAIDVTFFLHDSNGPLNMRCCRFQIENVGLGTAVDINFPFFHGCDENREQTNLVCKISEKHIVEIHAQFPKTKGLGTEFCTVTYSDLLGNDYYQHISMDNLNPDKYGITRMQVRHTSVPAKRKS